MPYREDNDVPRAGGALEVPGETVDREVGAARSPDHGGDDAAGRGAVAAFVVALVVGAVVRAWQLAGRGPSVWNDSTDFLTSAESGWLSVELWAGSRTAAVPLLLKLVGGDWLAYVRVQMALSAACWAALASSVAVVTPPSRRGWARGVSVAAVVALSIAFPVAMWERSVLSETLGLATLALLAAATVQLARGVTGWRVAGVAVALALWLLTRDSHTSVALVAAGALGIWLLVAVRQGLGTPRVRTLLAVLACCAGGLGLLAGASSSQGERHVLPLFNVYKTRILPYPDRVAWFADAGMPQSERFVGRGALVASADPGEAPMMHVGHEDPEFSELVDWVAADGRTALVRWMVTHPTYVFGEPWRDPERTFNNAEGDRGSYAPDDMRTVPVVTELVVPSRPLALAVAAVVAVVGVRRRWWRSPALVAGAAWVALAGPHALVAWHSDGMETARHLMVPVVQMHLGVVLMCVGAFAAALAESRPRASGPQLPGKAADVADVADDEEGDGAVDAGRAGSEVRDAEVEVGRVEAAVGLDDLAGDVGTGG
jgi:hypothetical protein